MDLKVNNLILTAADNINVAATTQTVQLFTLPPTSYILAFLARIKTAFAGVTNPQASVGDTVNLTYLMKKQVITATGDLFTGQGGRGYCERIVGFNDNQERNKVLTATFTSDAGNFSSLTTGAIEFVVVYAV